MWIIIATIMGVMVMALIAGALFFSWAINWDDEETIDYF